VDIIFNFMFGTYFWDNIWGCFRPIYGIHGWYPCVGPMFGINVLHPFLVQMFWNNCCDHFWKRMIVIYILDLCASFINHAIKMKACIAALQGVNLDWNSFFAESLFLNVLLIWFLWWWYVSSSRHSPKGLHSDRLDI